MKAPAFWQDPASQAGRMLAPLGWLYAEATAWRLEHAHSWCAPIPVVCVGNLTAGGAGKTPVVRDLAARLARMGRQPHILSRGYGGREPGPLRVDPDRHDAIMVGDEPLLLARDAPSWVARDRVAGARAIAAAGADLILMDDGLQNPSLFQDLRLVVVDGEAGFGNGRPIPAGPLREHVHPALARAHAMIIIGDDRHGLARAYGGRLPILAARLEPRDVAWLGGLRVLGFAGIGQPTKFRATLAAVGADLADFRSFPDHHWYSDRELSSLVADAEQKNAVPVTTEKDWVRLPPTWRDRIRAVPVSLAWQDAAALDALLAPIIASVSSSRG